MRRASAKLERSLQSGPHRRGRRCPSRLLLGLLFCLSGGASAQTDLGFEADAAHAQQGWTWAESARVSRDDSIATEGTRSLRIDRSEIEGASRATQRFAMPDLTGYRVRVSASVRTQSVTGGAGLFVRVDGPNGLLYVDSLRREALAGDSEWSRLTLDVPSFSHARTLTIGAILRGRGTAWFDAFALEDVMAPPDGVLPERARAYLDEVLDLLEHHAWRRNAVDWSVLRPAVYAQAAGALAPADAHLAVRFALGELGDGHSYLMAPDQVQSLDLKPVANARTREPVQAPRAEQLAPGVTYLWLPGFAGGPHAAQVEFAEAIQSLIAEAEGNAGCGWILDLRDNEGGNLWPMLAGIGPLLGAGDVGAAVYPDGAEQPYWYDEGRAGLGDFAQLRVRSPYLPRVPERPVAVLIGESTASSAESLALAFRGRAWARSFGAPTRGLTTVNRGFPLSDGSTLVLAVAATRDPLGNLLTGPVSPDVSVPLADRAVSLVAQPVVRAALEWIGSRSGQCTRAGG